MESQAETPIDSGLQSLITTALFHQLPAEAPQIKHQFGVPRSPLVIPKLCEPHKAHDLNKKQILTSPVNGVVQELAIHTIGGVVTEAQTLMKIVPENQQLEVEAWLENKDIGFVTTQQSAEVKIHTFNFTKYGIIDGHVETISSDATVDEQRGLIYKTKVLLTKNSLLVDGREVQLVPGMGASAEIKIGKRLLIEYITAPLLRYKDESSSEE